jgi:hypothetical protein
VVRKGSTSVRGSWWWPWESKLRVRPWRVMPTRPRAAAVGPAAAGIAGRGAGGLSGSQRQLQSGCGLGTGAPGSGGEVAGGQSAAGAAVCRIAGAAQQDRSGGRVGAVPVCRAHAAGGVAAAFGGGFALARAKPHHCGPGPHVYPAQEPAACPGRQRGPARLPGARTGGAGALHREAHCQITPRRATADRP